MFKLIELSSADWLHALVVNSRTSARFGNFTRFSNGKMFHCTCRIQQYLFLRTERNSSLATCSAVSKLLKCSLRKIRAAWRRGSGAVWLSKPKNFHELADCCSAYRTLKIFQLMNPRDSQACARSIPC